MHHIKLDSPHIKAPDWKVAVPVLGLLAGLLTASAGAAADPGNPEKPRALVDLSSCSKPVWPEESLRNGNHGTVTMAFLIGGDGRVKKSAITRSSGFARLDEAAREALSKCRFKPAMYAGKPAKAWLMMQYVWTLE